MGRSGALVATAAQAIMQATRPMKVLVCHHDKLTTDPAAAGGCPPTFFEGTQVKK